MVKSLNVKLGRYTRMAWPLWKVVDLSLMVVSKQKLFGRLLQVFSRHEIVSRGIVKCSASAYSRWLFNFCLANTLEGSPRLSEVPGSTAMGAYPPSFC